MFFKMENDSQSEVAVVAAVGHEGVEKLLFHRLLFSQERQSRPDVPEAEDVDVFAALVDEEGDDDAREDGAADGDDEDEEENAAADLLVAPLAGIETRSR